MALETEVAGAYVHTYNAVATGITSEGYELQQGSFAQSITPTDAYGESTIDLVYRGGDVYIQYESIAYKAGSITPFWPWGSALGIMGIIGRLASAVAAASVLTATTGTPAASAPSTVTTTLSILAPNNPAKLLYNSKLRTVPVRLLVLPYDSGSGVIKWWV